MAKGPEAFRTISEAAEELDVPQHGLRCWETKFSFIRPMKRAGGRRFYRPQDIAVLQGVRRLLHEEGYTIKGVQKLHKEHGLRRLLDPAAAVAEGGPEEEAAGLEPAARDRLAEILAELETAKQRIDEVLREVAGRPDFAVAPPQAPAYKTRPRRRRRSVAQPGSALDWGSRGRGFESRRSDHPQRMVEDAGRKGQRPRFIQLISGRIGTPQASPATI